MTFPTIPTSAAGRIVSSANTSPAGTHTFPNLNTLTAPAGDLIIALVIMYDGNSTNAEFSAWGASFTEFVDQATTTTMGIGAAYKWSSGSETGTFTVTSADTSTNDSVCILLSISGAHASTPPEGGTIGNGTAAAAAIAALDPAGWNTEDTLWVAVCGAGETSTTGAFTAPSAAPTNYSDLFVTALTADVVGGVYGAVAFRQLAAASDDPNNFTVDLSNARNSALLLAIRPAAEQPVGDPYQRDPRWYRANIFFRPSAEPFHTLGDATTPADITSVTLTDAGASDDALTVTADVPLTDTAAGNDSLAVAADVSLADTGAADDSTVIAADVPLTDIGSAADDISVIVGVIADPYQTPPLPFPPFTAPFIEPNVTPFQALGDATTTTVTQISLTDTGTGDDALTISAAIPLDDTGTGTDSISVTTGVDSYQAWPQFAAMFLQPSATSLQFLGDASGVTQISLTDSGTASDALSITVTGPLTDTAAGADTLSIAATLSLTDTAVGSDALDVAAAVPLDDAAAATDAVAPTAAVPLTDAAVGDDSLSVLIETVVDAYQAMPKRFGWALLQPEWLIPFQLLGGTEAAPSLVNALSTATVSAAQTSAPTAASGSTATATVSAGVTSTSSVSDG